MNRVILFTKAPNLNNSKTRLKNFLSQKERLELMRNLISQNYNLIDDKEQNPIIYYDGEKSDLDFLDGEKIQQLGNDLGEKMRNAIFDQLNSFDKVVLIGSDLENLSKDHIFIAIEKLDKFDVVIAPSIDGGYGLIAMKEKLDIFSHIIYSTPNLLYDTIKKIEDIVKSYFLLDSIRDIDTI